MSGDGLSYLPSSATPTVPRTPQPVGKGAGGAVARPPRREGTAMMGCRPRAFAPLAAGTLDDLVPPDAADARSHDVRFLPPQ